jgi:hypothetical protein
MSRNEVLETRDTVCSVMAVAVYGHESAIIYAVMTKRRGARIELCKGRPTAPHTTPRRASKIT